MDTVRGWMSSPAIVVRETTPLPQARRQMQEQRIRRLPVVDSAGQLVGIITEGDINRVSDSPATDVRDYNLYHRVGDLPIRDIMTRGVVTVAADTPILEVARLLPRQVAERARVLVLGRTNDGLRVATADPTNVVALDDVRAYTGAHSLSLVVATESMIQEHIARIYSMAEDARLGTQSADDASDPAEDAMLAKAADQAPTVRLVNQILSDAVRVGARKRCDTRATRPSTSIST